MWQSWSDARDRAEAGFNAAKEAVSHIDLQQVGQEISKIDLSQVGEEIAKIDLGQVGEEIAKIDLGQVGEQATEWAQAGFTAAKDAVSQIDLHQVGEEVAKIDLRQVGEQAAQWITENPEAAIAIGAYAAVMFAPALISSPALGVVGFGADGIAAGSAAAGIQSGIGNVIAPSVFATLQSAAMGGYGVAVVHGAIQLGATAVAGTGALLAILGNEEQHVEGLEGGKTPDVNKNEDVETNDGGTEEQKQDELTGEKKHDAAMDEQKPDDTIDEEKHRDAGDGKGIRFQRDSHHKRLKID
ncbi:hypothetical protein G7046_g7677 [Stylonectria norvegica]|nr:hypothetical protein G7046_g7677 [Stylonectria norvegica]